MVITTRYHYHKNGEAPTIESKWIFVFGSNLAGRHGAGAALKAKQAFGARIGVGFGLEGQSFALPTKNEQIETLPLKGEKSVEYYVRLAIPYIEHRIEMAHNKFWFTAVGTGLAGYQHQDIAPLFMGLGSRIADPRRVLSEHLSFPEEWRPYLEVDAHQNMLNEALFDGDIPQDLRT